MFVLFNGHKSDQLSEESSKRLFSADCAMKKTLVWKWWFGVGTQRKNATRQKFVAQNANKGERLGNMARLKFMP